MKIGKALKWSVAAVLGSFLLMGCGSTSGNKASHGEFAAFKGEWQATAVVADAEELNDVYATFAKEKADTYTEEGFKAAIYDAVASKVVNIKFDGSDTALVTIMKDGKKTSARVEYAYVGEVPMKGYDDHKWKAFEAKKDVKGMMDAKYFVATDVHSHDGGMEHWHGRFGAKSIDRLVNADDSWWPTFVDARIPRAELIKGFKDSVKGLKDMIQDVPFNSLKGKWVNTASLYESDLPEVKEVFDNAIKDFAGKNGGKDFTKDDIMKMVKESYGTTDNFTHLEFISSNDKNELVIYSGKNVVARGTYKRDAAIKGKEGRMAFTATSADMGKFTHFVSTGVHGDPAHIHLWYGSTEAEVNETANGKYPTCMRADASAKDIAKRIKATVENMLKGASK